LKLERKKRKGYIGGAPRRGGEVREPGPGFPEGEAPEDFWMEVAFFIAEKRKTPALHFGGGGEPTVFAEKKTTRRKDPRREGRDSAIQSRGFVSLVRGKLGRKKGTRRHKSHPGQKKKVLTGTTQCERKAYFQCLDCHKERKKGENRK